MPNLPERGVDRLDDVHRHALDRALGNAHLERDDFVDREVVDRLFDAVLGGVSLNKEKLADAMRPVTDADLIAGKYLLVQRGKKNYYLVIAE